MYVLNKSWNYNVWQYYEQAVNSNLQQAATQQDQKPTVQKVDHGMYHATSKHT